VVQWGPYERVCTLEATLYGYYPNLGVNAFFTAFFAICFIWNLFCGIRYKTWTYMVRPSPRPQSSRPPPDSRQIALCFGCAGEAVGYGGRIMMYNDVFDDNAFTIQICCLIVSPAFISAGIYLTLKHITMSFGESWSRLKPVWYTRLFITGDIFSLVLQGAGGGIASTAPDGSNLTDIGTNMMIAGVVFQVVILLFFGYFLVEYTVRTYRRRDQLSASAMTLFQKTSFRLFMGAVIVAYVGVFIRCIYRVPELALGWMSELMRNEVEFIVLEGVMIVISVLALTVFHPGYCFPALGSTFSKSKAAKREKSLGSDADADVEMMASNQK